MHIWRRIINIASILTLSVCILYSVLCLVPNWNIVSFISSVLLASLAPWLILLSLAAGAGWYFTASQTFRRKGIIGFAATLLALAVPSWALGATVVTAARHGGSVNPVTALALQSMSAPPDGEHSYGSHEISGSVALYQPDPTTAPDAGAPVLFDIHGGGWNQDSQMQATLRYFADNGWLVIRPTYTLATETQATSELVPKQLACAYAWTLRNAQQLGGDPRHIAVMGDSAGGGLAISLVQRLARGEVHTECGPVDTQPRALFALYPTVSLTAIAHNTFLGTNKAAVNFIGATPEQAPQDYLPLDAKNWVTNKMPPTLILQGSQDSFVPAESVRAYAAQARSAGAEVQLIEAPLLNHAFDISFRNSAGWQLATSIALAFLADH